MRVLLLYCFWIWYLSFELWAFIIYLMPKRFILLFIFCFLFFFSAIKVSADNPTPTTDPNITVAPSYQPTCDLCGWCNPASNPKPPNWESCNKCLYQDDGTPRQFTYYTAIGCLSTKSDLFVKSILSIVFGVAGGIAFLAVLAGTFIVLTSAGDPDKLQNGKDIITSSIFGILLILFSVFLLRLVGLEILAIPGFGWDWLF